MTHTIDSISNDSRSMNETNDCTVRAIVATTGRPYKDVHAALKARGRRNRKGAYDHQWLPTIEDMGFKYVDVTRQIPGRTVRTATRYLPRGRKFIIQVRRHVAGFDGSTLLDWSKGRQHRVLRVYEIIPAEQLQPVVVKHFNDDTTIDVSKMQLFVKVIAAKNANTFNAMFNEYKIVQPPARVNREKWARENARTICAHGHTGVIELKGDAAVNFRKANNVRGKVFMLFGYKRA